MINIRYDQGSRGGLAIYSTINGQRFETQAFYFMAEMELPILPALLKAVERKDNSYDFTLALTYFPGGFRLFKEIFLYPSNLPHINLFLKALTIKVSNLNIAFRNSYLIIISLNE